MNAMQTPWEGAQALGPPPMWDKILFHIGQGLKSVSSGGPMFEPGRNQDGPRVGSPALEDSNQGPSLRCTDAKLIKDSHSNQVVTSA